jgi:hypothetical protein
MWTNGSLDEEGALPAGTTERGGAGSGLVDAASGGGMTVDDGGVAALSAVPTPAGALGRAASVQEQLRRLELRLLTEAGGDPTVERDVRRHLAESCARFETARVRLFVPILVEREVHRRLRDGERSA